jgi:hypothetical protein
VSEQAKQSKTDWRTVHRRLNTDYLYSEDLGGRKSIDLEIVDSGVAKLKERSGKSKEMPWLAFRGAKKKLALGATMCKTMTTLTGTKIIEDWRGWITLVVIKTTYKDQDTGHTEETDAIRIAPKRPTKKQANSQTSTDAPASAETTAESEQAQ